MAEIGETLDGVPTGEESIAERLTATGLDREVQCALESAASVLRGVRESTWFVSSRSVIDVLVSLPSIGSGNTCVVSREDSRLFWSQDSRDRYINRLRSDVGKGSLKQLRVMVYGDLQKDRLMPPDDIYFALYELHAPKTFRTCEVSNLGATPLLHGARFGVTLLRRERVAIVPMGEGDLTDVACSPAELRIPVDGAGGYSGGALRALIVLDPLVVTEMLREFDAIWALPSTVDAE